VAANGNERTNIPLQGVEWQPPGYATAPLDERHWYWQQLAGFALTQKRDEILRGIGVTGRKLKPVSPATKAKGRWRSVTGMGRADGPPLDPADEVSRTYKLLSAHVMVDGVTLYWRSSGRKSWQTILAYHRAGAGGLPVRNTIGISPAGRKKIKKQAWDAWAAREAVERPRREAAWKAKRKPPKVGKPPKGPIAKALPREIKRAILIEAPEGQLIPTRPRGGPPGAPPAAPKPKPKPKPKAPKPAVPLAALAAVAALAAAWALDHTAVLEWMDARFKEFTSQQITLIKENLGETAASGPLEFIAEVHARLLDGTRPVPAEIMALYQVLGGVIP
jgi:hypothetical protein